ncbi:hypothetical protein ACFC01_17985 [Streptomyces mirabilis]|uniref:hypothetical protein n=1 Tax=Streptomyces mirabilis TaxID=68239 RepID=UPI0035E0109A
MPEPCRPLAPGDVIHGFANGAFGRDHYDCVRVEAVGPDWIVARAAHEDFERTPGPSFASGRRELELCQQARDRRCEHESGLCPFAGTEPPLTTYGERPA